MSSNKAPIDEITYSYIFNFRTTPCVLFSQSKCDRSQPYTCSRAHSPLQLRRKPVAVNGEWSFSVKLCASGSLTDCPMGKMCRSSHAQQMEHLYHPLVFRTQWCPKLPDCPDPHCPMAHKKSELQRPGGLLAKNAPVRSPQFFPTTDLSGLPHFRNVSRGSPLNKDHTPPLPDKLNKGRYMDMSGNTVNLSSSIRKMGSQGRSTSTPMEGQSGYGMSNRVGNLGGMHSQQRMASSRVGREVAMPSRDQKFVNGGSFVGGDMRRDKQQRYYDDAPYHDQGSDRSNSARPGTGMGLGYQSSGPKTDGRVTPPFAPSEMEPLLQWETAEHARYIYGFRVNACELAKQNRCPHEDMYSCFDVHPRMARRRKPNLQHGRFNYIPTRCRYILEDRECPQGLHCRFAHCTEEVIYHPSKYKTQMCTHQLDAAGHCSGYGCHCAKAHGENDRRNPVFEGTLEESLTQTSGEDYSDFVIPEADRESERQYYMFHYKTQKCEGFPWNCQCNGFDYHRDKDRRRKVINYSPVACPNVKPFLNGDWRDPNVDCTGGGGIIPPNPDGSPVEWKCEYAHTLLELMYHPQVYKTSMCDHFDEHEVNKWQCVWKRRCAHAHGKADLRDRAEATEEWRQHCLRTGFKPSAPLSLLSGSMGSSGQKTPNAQSRPKAQSPLTSRQSGDVSLIPDMGLSSKGQGGSIGAGLASNAISLTNPSLTRDDDSNSSMSFNGNRSFLFLNQNNRDMWGGNWKSSSSTSAVASASASASSSEQDPTYVHEVPRQTQGSEENADVTRLHPADHFKGPILTSAASSARPANLHASDAASTDGTTASDPQQRSRRNSDSSDSSSNSLASSGSKINGQINRSKSITGDVDRPSANQDNKHPTSSAVRDDGWGKPRLTDAAGQDSDRRPQQKELTGAGGGKRGPSLEVDPKRIIQIGTDRVRMHEGILNIGGTAMTVAVKVFHSGHYDIAALLKEIDTVIAHFRNKRYFVHYFSRVVLSDKSAVLLALDVNCVSLRRPNTNRPRGHGNGPPINTLMTVGERLGKLPLPPLKTRIRWARQMWNMIAILHKAGLSHGDLGADSIFVSHDEESIVVGDLARPRQRQRQQRRGAGMQSADDRETLIKDPTEDVFHAGWVTYCLLAAGELGGAEHVPTDFPDAEILALLEPKVGDVVKNTLLAQPKQRMTAAEVAHHCLFWSTDRKLRFLFAVATYLRDSAAQNVALVTAIDAWGTSICPAETNGNWMTALPHSVASGLQLAWELSSSSGERLLPRINHHRILHLLVALHLASRLMYLRVVDKAVSCSLHEAFGIPHLPTCKNPTPNADMPLLSLTMLNIVETSFPKLMMLVFRTIYPKYMNEPAFVHFFVNSSSAVPADQSTRAAPRAQHRAGQGSKPPPSPVENSLSTDSELSVDSQPLPALGAASKALALSPKMLARQAADILKCPFDDPPHLLNQPITTPCCGHSFCRRCLPQYFSSLRVNSSARPHKKRQWACICGKVLSRDGAARLSRSAPSTVLVAMVNATRFVQQNQEALLESSPSQVYPDDSRKGAGREEFAPSERSEF
eukprot:g4755.t1